MIENDNLFTLEEEMYDELSLEEGFKKFIKDFYILSEETGTEKLKKALINIKTAKKYVSNNPEKPFSKFVKTTIRFCTYIIASGAAYSIGYALLGPVIGLIAAVTVAVCRKKIEDKIRRKQNDQLYFFYEDNVEWLSEKINDSEDDKEKKNLLMLRAKYKSSLLRLQTPEKFNPKKSEFKND